MIQKLSKSAKRHLVCLVVTTSALILLFIALSLKIWLCLLAILLVVGMAAFVCRLFLMWRRRWHRIHSMHNERLFKLLHDLLDIAYIYGNDHKKFYAKFIEIVNVKSLSRRKIINPDAILKTSKYNHEFGEMKRSDAEFLALLSTRLSYRALTVVYKLKDRNSVYVKRHRLQERLSKRMKQFLEDIRE